MFVRHRMVDEDRLALQLLAAFSRIDFFHKADAGNWFASSVLDRLDKKPRAVVYLQRMLLGRCLGGDGYYVFRKHVGGTERWLEKERVFAGGEQQLCSARGIRSGKIPCAASSFP